MSATAVAVPSVRTASPGLLTSTIGRKAVMAATGCVLFGFVFAHMVGNLQVYLGPEAMNHYAVFLRSMLHGWGLWIARSVLVVSVGLHIWAATTLTLQSWRARPLAYQQWEARESTYASRTMRWGGVILFLFVAYHLQHFTFGNLHPDFRPGDVYHNFVAGFREVPASVIYIVAMLALGLHLYHGGWSMLRTLGVSHPRYLRMAKAAALLFALVVTAGNISFPVAVLAGVIR
jgi:succinate dehydrogenase / fumarate reductase cytochrome b subunit